MASRGVEQICGDYTRSVEELTRFHAHGSTTRSEPASARSSGQPRGLG